MRLTVLYHDNCFDGVASAAIFSRFYRERINRSAEFKYTGLMHRAGRLFNEDQFDGDENAIVDFKYSSSPRLTWWFDHHQSAFLTKEDELHFRGDRSGKKFLDPSFKSCTKFIAKVCSDRFGFDAQPMAELVEWADIIDGAQYPDAKTAVEMEAPALKILLVVETARDKNLIQGLITQMQEEPLEQIAVSAEIRERFESKYRQHLESLEIIKGVALCEDGVTYFDVSGHEMEGYNKFIPYYLFPEAQYNVGVSLSSHRAKVSVGSNPWSPKPRKHNLAQICERYGGGGHAAVAAISFGPDQLELARKVADEIVSELRSEPTVSGTKI